MTQGGASAGTGALGRSMLDTIGGTPLVELRHVCDEAEGRLVAKLECSNPTGSKADRVAKVVLEDATAAGYLSRCQTVAMTADVASSLAFAHVCAVLRHPLVVVLSRGASVDVDTLAAYGCEVVLVDQHPSSPRGRVTALDRALCTAELQKIVRVTGAFDPDLLRNPSAFRAHRLGTGQEIVRQLDGQFGVFVDFVGTGATLAGCAAAFQERDTRVRCYAAEPVGAAALSGEAVVVDDHGIDGGGLGLAQLPLLSPERLAGVVRVTYEEARRAQSDLARKEGLLAGLSTGANVAAARKLLHGECFGETVVVVVHDSGPRRPTATAALERGLDAA